MKRCSRCKDWLDESLFGSNKSTKDGLCNYCLECNRIIAKARPRATGVAIPRGVALSKYKKQKLIVEFGEAVAEILSNMGENERFDLNDL